MAADAHLMTDDYSAYFLLGKEFASHSGLESLRARRAKEGA